jgi:hypothetical protein
MWCSALSVNRLATERGGAFGLAAAVLEALFIHDWRAEPLTSPDNVDEVAGFGPTAIGCSLNRCWTEEATGRQSRPQPLRLVISRRYPG